MVSAEIKYPSCLLQSSAMGFSAWSLSCSGLGLYDHCDSDPLLNLGKEDVQLPSLISSIKACLRSVL